jgi:hypothetical protein
VMFLCATSVFFFISVTSVSWGNIFRIENPSVFPV